MEDTHTMSIELKDAIDATAEKATLEQLVAQRTPLDGIESNQEKVAEGAATSPDTEDDSVVGAIDPVKKKEYEEKFHALLLNPRFWGNENRVKRMEAALVMPMYDDPSMRMFYDSAYDELYVAECKAARTEKRIPEDVTEAQICELAEQKHYEKYVLAPAKKAEKEAKKAAKKK
jgi:hypothetical protein